VSGCVMAVTLGGLQIGAATTTHLYARG
jgi:hypothetical protein